jgi:hypothetical protein
LYSKEANSSHDPSIHNGIGSIAGTSLDISTGPASIEIISTRKNPIVWIDSLQQQHKVNVRVVEEGEVKFRAAEGEGEMEGDFSLTPSPSHDYR